MYITLPLFLFFFSKNSTLVRSTKQNRPRWRYAVNTQRRRRCACVCGGGTCTCVCVRVSMTTCAAPKRSDSDKWQTKGDWAPRFTYAATPICLTHPDIANAEYSWRTKIGIWDRFNPCAFQKNIYFYLGWVIFTTEIPFCKFNRFLAGQTIIYQNKSTTHTYIRIQQFKASI